MKTPSSRRGPGKLDRRLSSAEIEPSCTATRSLRNFCFGKYAVAAVRLIMSGGGCRMKDVAYLLDEERYLDLYFAELRARLSPDLDADALEQEWRSWPSIARLDYERFLDGWRRI